MSATESGLNLRRLKTNRSAGLQGVESVARGGLTTADRRQLDALGLRDLTADELRAAQLRMERFEAPTPAAEVNRLEMKLQQINAVKNVRLASDCHKAIAQLRVFVRLEQADLLFG